MIKDSLKKGFEVLFSSFPVLFAWIVLQGAVYFFLNVSLLGDKQQDGEIPSITPLGIMGIGLWILWIIAYLYMRAGTLAYVRDKINLERATFSSFLSLGREYFFPLVRFSLAFCSLLLLLTIGVALLFFAILAFMEATTEVPSSQMIMMGLGTGFFSTIVLVNVCFYFLMLYAPTILVADELKAFAAMKSSAAIACKWFKKTWGLALLFLLIYSINGTLSFISYNVFSGGIQIALLAVSAVFAAFAEVYLTAVIMNCYLRIKTLELK